MRIRRTATAIALAVAAVLTGCGVPDSGPPVVDSAVPPLEGEGQEPTEPLPRPGDAKSGEEMIRLYFQAAAIDPVNLSNQVRLFISREGEARFRPVNPHRIPVVRVDWGGTLDQIPGSSDRYQLKVTGRVIGVLTNTGILLPASRPFSHTFKVHQTDSEDVDYQGSPEWLIDDPPSGYVLSDDALQERYREVSLYYSNQRSTASLIADLRYVPEVIERKKELSLLVDWLLQSPSPWLAPVAVRSFPSGTKRLGNVYREHGKVVVTLSREAEKSDRPDLMLAQLVWTLSEIDGDKVQLRIEDRIITYRGTDTHTRSAFLGFNAVAAQWADEQQQWYYISSEKKLEAQPGMENPRVLDDDVSRRNHNHGLTAAAVSRSKDLAALVKGQRSLVVGLLAKAGGVPTYQEVAGLPRGGIGRPVWVAGGGESLLVPAQGRLYRVDIDRSKADELDLPSQLAEVSAVSMAPDGYRAALISGGRLFVASVARRGDRIAIAATRLVTDQIHRAVDVAWMGEHSLAVAGEGPANSRGLWRVDINGLKVDSIPSEPLRDVPAQVAAQPAPGPNGPNRALVLISLNNKVYQVFSSRLGGPAGRGSFLEGSSPFFAF